MRAGRGRLQAATLGDRRPGQRRPAAGPARRPRRRPDGPAPATRLPPATRRRLAGRLLDSPPAGHRFTQAGSSRHPRPRPRLHPPAAVLRSSADRSAGRPSPGGLNSDRATPAHSDAPHRTARRGPDFEPGPDRRRSDPEIHHRPVMGRATPIIGAPGVSQPAGVSRGVHPAKIFSRSGSLSENSTPKSTGSCCQTTCGYRARLKSFLC